MSNTHKDWTKHGLMNPPEDASGRQAWVADAFWILFGKLEGIQDRLDKVGATRAHFSGYLQAIAGVGILLYALSAILANVASTVCLLKG